MAGNNSYQYKYNGKELQETGMLDYGWRQYMPELGRWNGMDQLAEMYNSVSPFAYVGNNPINMFDPDGRLTEAFTDQIMNSPSGTTWYNNNNGSFTNNWGDTMSNDGIGGGSSPTEIGIYGKFAQAAFDLLKESMKGQLNLTFKDGKISGSAVKGATLSDAATWLLEAINNPDIKIRLETVGGFRFYDTNLKQDVYFPGGAFRGSFEYNGNITATNIVSPKVMEGYDTALNIPIET